MMFVTAGSAFSTNRENRMKRAMVVLGAVAALVSTGQVAAADGKAVYEKSCKGCHSAMKPKTGDKAAWAPRMKAGIDGLTASVTKGKGAMPPKGGLASATDAELRAAVEHMVASVK